MQTAHAEIKARRAVIADQIAEHSQVIRLLAGEDELLAGRIQIIDEDALKLLRSPE